MEDQTTYVCAACDSEFSVECHNDDDDTLPVEYCPFCGSVLIDDQDFDSIDDD